MSHLRRADAEGERADGAVRRRMAVAADHDHAGLAQALLRPDDMHDALPAVVEAEQRDAGVARVGLQVLDHARRFGSLIAERPRPVVDT